MYNKKVLNKRIEIDKEVKQLKHLPLKEGVEGLISEIEKLKTWEDTGLEIITDDGVTEEVLQLVIVRNLKMFLFLKPIMMLLGHPEVKPL